MTPKITRPVRIVVLADLQTDEIGPYERDVFRRILQEKPDLILLAGDYIQMGERPTRIELHEELNAFLGEIRFDAPDGVFAVGGNIDWADWSRSFRGSEITPIRRTCSFELAELRLTCLALHESADTRLRVAHDDPDRFHVVLGHVPNFARGSIEADLLLAGHTHGGQVRLPLIGPVMTLSTVPRSWAAGRTELPGGATLLVSRGIGMERGGAPRLRFLCRPELVVIDLVPAPSSP